MTAQAAKSHRPHRLLAATIPHRTELVWRALADDALLGEWLEDADMQPSVGHRFTVHRPALDCEVTCVERGRRLEVACVAGRGAGARLRWTLDPLAGGGTRLTLAEQGPLGPGTVALGVMVALAWRFRLRHRLERCLAAHEGEPLAPPLL